MEKHPRNEESGGAAGVWWSSPETRGLEKQTRKQWSGGAAPGSRGLGEQPGKPLRHNMSC